MNKKKTNWTKAGVVVTLIIGILTIILMIYYGRNNSDTIQDDDLLDNNGATSPTTVINMDYKKPNRILNENLKKELQNRLNDFNKLQDTITIFYTCGAESQNLSHQYLEYLQKIDWRVTTTTLSALVTPQIDGVSFNKFDKEDKTIELQIFVGCDNN